MFEYWPCKSWLMVTFMTKHIQVSREVNLQDVQSSWWGQLVVSVWQAQLTWSIAIYKLHMHRFHYRSMTCIHATCNIPFLPRPETMEWSKGNGKMVPILMPLHPMCRSYHMMRLHQIKCGYKNSNPHCTKSCKCRGCHVYEQWALTMLWRENVTVVLVSCTQLKCVCKNNSLIVVESHHVNCHNNACPVCWNTMHQSSTFNVFNCSKM